MYDNNVWIWVQRQSWSPVTRGIPIHGVGGTRTGPMGYVVMRVEIEGVPSYAEDQVFPVIDNNSAYSRRVPVILGTLAINRVVMAMAGYGNAYSPTGMAILYAELQVCQWILHGNGGCCVGGGGCDCYCHQHCCQSLGTRRKGSAEREIHRPCFRYSRPTGEDRMNDDVGPRPAQHHASPLRRRRS